MLNKLLEQIQMMIGYQKSKKIGRFITLFFAISVSELLGVAYTQIRNPDSNLSLLGRS